MKGRALAGFHAVAARLKHAVGSIECLYVAAGRNDGRMRRLLDAAAQANVRVVPVDEARLRGLAGEVPHQGVVALCAEDAAPTATLDDVLNQLGPQTLLLLLDGVTDPRNMGACLRTAAAAGVQAVLVPRDRSAAMSPVVAKAAAGAAETVPLVAVTNLARTMEELKQAGVWIAGAVGEAERSLYDLDLKGPLAWVLGAEGEGLRRLTRERCDWLARIPLHGSVDSLNVSVAAGVCLFETQRQRGVAMPAADG
jgi:23S rRNA (guanosine2251-2'-O)-methyltransferase